jgi:hypothetical protein
MPQLSGPLAGLKILEVSDLALYKAAVEAGRQVGWGYYFPYLLSRNRPDREAMLLGEDEGSLCVFLWQFRDATARLDLYLPPTPMNPAVLRRALERANDFNGNLSARIMRIDAKDAEALSGLRDLRTEQRKLQYLYAPRNYSNLSGKHCYTVRRNVALVGRLPDVDVVPYSASYAEACRELLRRWSRYHRDAHGTGGGVTTSERAIELATVFSDTELRGEVVLVNGRVSAFAFGGAIRSAIGCIFDTRSDVDVRGLSYFHRRSLLLKLQDFELVNDGSDAGRLGLRQLKDSFRPVEMHAEYRAFQRDTMHAEGPRWESRSDFG